MKFAMYRRTTKYILFVSALLLLCTGCSNLSPHFIHGVTPAPTQTIIPSLTPAPTHRAENTHTDALGNTVYDADHYKRYLQFSYVTVYEEGGETFLDCKVTNSYPEILVCGVSVCFYEDDGRLLASSKLQMPDGSFLLTLSNGETHLYARILTDSNLTDREFELVFDDAIGVNPQT